MDLTDGLIRFLGDLSDPWVAAIADALPALSSVRRIDCPGDVPDRPFEPSHPPRLVIVHRQHWTASDARRFKSWREPMAASPALFLCFSPYFRHEELERLSALFDQTISEAVAGDVLPGRVARLIGGNSRPFAGKAVASFRIEVACGTDELGEALAQRFEDAGFRARTVDDSAIGTEATPRVSSISSTERVLTIWEVPVLTENWPQRLQTRALALGPVIALAGFADRAIVTTARSQGACACLDFPFDSDDLLDVVDRVSRSFAATQWPLPPRAESRHVLPPRSRRRAAASTGSSPLVPSLWSHRGPPSTMKRL